MQSETFTFDGYHNTRLPGVLWLPEKPPRMIVQITHGMTEHAGRFESLARFLTEHGIAAAGFDLRGHGHNPGDPLCASMGKSGWEASIEDMHLFFQLLDSRFPGIPHVMLGFSLGSFLLREYLGKYPRDAAGAAILGTGRQPVLVLSILTAIVRGQCRKYGFDSSTPLVRKLSFETYNQHFRPTRTSFDWLCSDNEQLDRYQTDPLCRKDISAGLFLQLLESMKRTEDVELIRNWNLRTPILLLSGLDDAVGDFGKGILRIGSLLTRLGFPDVTVHLVPQARHDVLHEERSGAAGLARNLLLQWLEKSIV